MPRGVDGEGAGILACPECGSTISAKGREPGRQVICADCGTLIEVPFLSRPRPFQFRKEAAVVPPVVYVLAGILAVIGLTAIATKQVIRARHRAATQATMADLHHRIATAAQEDRPDTLLGAIDEALDHADLAWDPSELGEFDRLRRKALSRLADRAMDALRTGEGFDGLSEAAMTADRMADEEGLGDVRSRLVEAVRERLVLATDRGLANAEALLSAGKPPEALDACLVVLEAVRVLPTWADGEKAEFAAQKVARRIATDSGAVLEPIEAKLWLGSSEVYEKALRPLALEVFRQKGYAPEPAEPSFRPIWAEFAPNRLTIQVEEQADHFYLQSANRMTRIEAEIRLRSPGLPEWHQQMRAKTRPHVPGLMAIETMRFSVGKEPIPEVQKRLHDDAYGSIIGVLSRALKGLPDRPSHGPTSSSPH